MKKLSKKLHSCNQTVQAFACECGCNCGCSCGRLTRAAKRVTIRYQVAAVRTSVGLSNNMP